MWGVVEWCPTSTVVAQSGRTRWGCKVPSALGLHIIGLSIRAAAVRVVAPCALQGVVSADAGSRRVVVGRRHLARETRGGRRGGRLQAVRRLRLDAHGLRRRRVLASQSCRHYGVQIVHVERVLAQQLRAARRVSLLVARAKVLPDEGAVAVGKVAVVDLLGIVCVVSVSCIHCSNLGSLTVQLVPVQMLGARVALPAALVRTLELLVQALPAPPALAGARGIVAVAAVFVAAVTAAPAPLAAVWRCGRGRLSRGGARLHLLGELGLYLAQLRRVPCMHGEDLRRHCHGRRGPSRGRVVLGQDSARVWGRVEFVSRWRGLSRVRLPKDDGGLVKESVWRREVVVHAS
jgi:hypothetical protein